MAAADLARGWCRLRPQRSSPATSLCSARCSPLNGKEEDNIEKKIENE
jgi:hypothetical protein